MNLRKFIAVLLCLVLAVSAAGCSSGSMDEYLEQHQVEMETGYNPVQTPSDEVSGGEVSGSDISGGEVSGSDVTTTTTTTTTTATTTTTSGLSTTLPEMFIGSWEVIGIYQEAVASDISAEEALRREQMNGISFGSSYFDRSGESVSGAVFIVNTKATYDDMEAFGIRTEPLAGPYGKDAKITSVEVRTADGLTCTTVFLINDITLVAFGAGMNVYTYELMNAVG